MNILEIKNLTKIYPGGVKAAANLNLSVVPGEIFGFLGHNGAGKTTTMRAAAGALPFDEGEITICGHDIIKEPEAAKQKLAYIPDSPDLYDYLTGLQFLNFIADIYGVSKDERADRIKKYADMLGITARLPDLISGYSHGMRQKTALISALLHAPTLLMLDEPFVGLDPEAALNLKAIMRELCQAGGAVFFSTHILEVAQKLCNRIAIIKNGEIIASGDTAEITREASLEEIFMEITTDGGEK